MEAFNKTVRVSGHEVDIVQQLGVIAGDLTIDNDQIVEVKEPTFDLLIDKIRKVITDTSWDVRR